MLQLLGDLFENESVEIDQSMSNLSRTTRLYGTLNMKGKEDVAGARLHRLSYLIDPVPEICDLYSALDMELTPYLYAAPNDPGETPDKIDEVLVQELLQSMSQKRKDSYPTWLAVGIFGSCWMRFRIRRCRPVGIRSTG